MPKMDAAKVSQIFGKSEYELTNHSLNPVKLNQLAYNPAFSYEENFDAMMWLFRPSAITKSQIEDIVSRSDPHFRCSGDSTRRALSREAASYLANRFLKVNKIFAEDTARNGNAFDGITSGNAKRLTIFLQTEDSEQAREFNERFLNAYRSGTPLERGQVIAEEINRLRVDLGFMYPEDVYSLMDMDDKTLVKNLPNIYRFLKIMGESQKFGGAEFTEKQQEMINRFRDPAMGLVGVIDSRVSMIANPSYEFIGPETLYSRNLLPSMTVSNDVLEDEDFSAKGDGREPGAQPIHEFFSSWSFVSSMAGDMVREVVCAKEPRLNNATWSVEGNTPQELASAISGEVTAFRPVVARLNTGEVRVVADPYTTKAQSLEQYLGALSAIADKSNRFLFTGSKQFDRMDAVMKSLLPFTKPGAKISGEELDQKMQLLQQRAQEYLEYKGYDKSKMNLADGYDPENLPESKNNREKIRIELASKLINLTKAHAKVRQKTKDLDKKLAEQDAVKKTSATAKNSKSGTLISAETFHKNANAKLHFIPKGRAKDAPFQLSADTTAGLSEFGMLALFGAASPDTKYRTKSSEEGKEYNEHVNDPDKAYPELLSNVIFRDVKANYNRGAIASASALIHKCKSIALDAIEAADGGNFELMGKLVADGLKQNTKLMNSQKSINDDFIAYSGINAKALDLMACNPELEAAVTKNMTQAELNAAKAAAAMGKVHVEGLKSLDKLANSGYLLNATHEKDIINVFQMSYVDNQFASKTVALEQSPYGSDPALSEKINDLLSKSIDTAAIISSRGESVRNLLSNRNSLSEACNNIILESQKKEMANSNPQPEKQLNKENEGKVMG